MRAKSMVLILIALGCGLVASIAISQVLERNASGNATLETVKIYVATTDIDVNEQLTATNVRVEDWPKTKIPEGSIADLESITDQFARVRFYEGEPILRAKLASEIEGPAIKIPEGFRVCSLKVQMDTAVSGLVNPGDRVDIFGYFRKSQDVPRTGTRELLRNVRVFAVNSETDQETDQDGQPIVAKTVSVLVEQGHVAKLMLATELGTLRLALRRPNEDAESNESEKATIESLFGGRSEDADEPTTRELSMQKNTGSQLAAAAGGLANFLSNLKQNNVSTGLAGMQSQGPSWQMTVLTPEGGTNFTWNHENQLPQEGNGAAAMPSSGASLATTPFDGMRMAPVAPADEGLAEPQDSPVNEEAEPVDDQQMDDG